MIFQIHSIKKAIAQQSSIGLDSLGTHCLENFFGNVCNHFKQFFLRCWIKKRLNEGGARNNPSLEEQRISINADFHHDDFAGIMLNYAEILFHRI